MSLVHCFLGSVSSTLDSLCPFAYNFVFIRNVLDEVSVIGVMGNARASLDTARKIARKQAMSCNNFLYKFGKLQPEVTFCFRSRAMQSHGAEMQLHDVHLGRTI